MEWFAVSGQVVSPSLRGTPPLQPVVFRARPRHVLYSHLKGRSTGFSVLVTVSLVETPTKLSPTVQHGRGSSRLHTPTHLTISCHISLIMAGALRSRE
ncbi:hypothetical protein E2C01_042922 [Portunus trituberculatus]|uniref:Uncharacterized protein n=1 Tax=Portunus trituberculatus TaxID=210409 RepID=A0A5B7FUP5_PORTR|nr:hypothetical protein [Portunus trituberculatus]